MEAAQVRTKQRVTDHGEVYTAKREVDAMLDLVKDETERIDSRFLEPACGHGNFLTAILERKLDVIERKYGKSQVEFERYSVVAIGSIYGIDLLDDNIIEARERLLEIFTDRYVRLFRHLTRHEVLDSVRFILSRNIIVGDALELRTSDGEPIVFSEWSLVTGDLIKRRDYAFDDAFIPDTVAEFPLIDFVKISTMSNAV
jgi:hypothetical protein